MSVDSLLWYFLLVFLVNFGKCSKNNTFEEFYNLGKSAYLENDWKNCAHYFESSLQAYHKYINVTLYCKSRCRNLKETHLIENGR